MSSSSNESEADPLEQKVHQSSSCWDCCTKPLCCSVVRPATSIGDWMYGPWRGVQSAIPPKLQGVLYMDGNPAPDSCYVLNGAKWDDSDPDHPKLRVYDDSAYTLSYPATCSGWGFFCVQCFCPQSLEFTWESAALERASIDLYYCHCCGPVTCVGKWDIVEMPDVVDPAAPEGGVVWKRISLKPDGEPRPDGEGSYTLRKIVSAAGTQVPSQWDHFLRSSDAADGAKQMVRCCNICV